MMGFVDRLLSWFKPSHRQDGRTSSDIKKKYKDFRALLSANNAALELMAEMSRMLDSSQTYSMSFVRGHATALSVNVYKMVTSLRSLSGGKYEALLGAFDHVAEKLEAVIDPNERVAGDSPMTLPLRSIGVSSADIAGEKMANLAEVARIGLKIPEGFVITARAARHFLNHDGLQDEINRKLKTLDADNLESLFTTSAAIQQDISNAKLPADLEDAILRAYEELIAQAGGESLVAMRSSAIGEDSRGASFAGQYRTNLNVDKDFIVQSYREIVAGKYKAEAIVYRTERGYRHQDVQMCVGCLVMVNAAVSGVTYTRCPSDLRSKWLEITATSGQADGVVSGRAESHIYKVGRQQPYDIFDGPQAEISCLSREQITAIADASLQIEEHFGLPQDIEWSIDKSGQLIILQSRPIPESTTEFGASVIETSQSSDVIVSGGITASQGVGSGKAFTVRSAVEMLRFPHGAVLVVDAAQPQYAALVPRATAIVCETGTPAAHLATVSREFKVPALFGVQGAINTMKDSPEITVDATARRIFKGRRDELLSISGQQRNLMRGSPMEDILKNALAVITPLNLIDPGSSFFRPASCETMHDITRFCHEKAVNEMFSIGTQRRRDHTEAKQLVDESPFHWWVLNLDDGFRADYDTSEHFVRIDDIVSVPMRALWDGMIAVPWEGPPPIDIRGFGSILFRSTMNPQLDPAVRSNLIDRNYFLVSKSFCNLSVRLGYHFTLSEAHIGEHSIQNYVSFTFKGGAADRIRRQLRVQLLKDILERYGFRVEQMMDSLVARIERQPEEYLISRLRIIGYLIMHTRQIDMVMEDEDAVERFKSKFSTEIEGRLIAAEG